MEKKAESATYTHGHHAYVLRSHSWRTARNSVGFVLPYLKPGMKVLDIGCGAGTITVDLAEFVPGGHVTGLDRSDGVLDQARALAKERGVNNIDFVEGDANRLTYDDESFDVVMCHQVLQHVRDPVSILKEMRRVTKIGGIVAARDGDYGVFVWYPESRGLSEWQSLYSKVARHNGGEPDAGRFLHVWAKHAGFTDIKCSTTSWCYYLKDDVERWSETWAERTAEPSSTFAKTATAEKLATSENLESIAQAWRDWGKDENAWISVPSGEILCRKD